MYIYYITAFSATLISRYKNKTSVPQFRTYAKQFKFKSNQQLKVAALNVRRLNQLAKRETQIRSMKKKLFCD